MSIANELSRLLQAKSDLATAITNKGVTVPANATLDDYAALVDSIQTGGGTLPYDAEIEYLESTGAQWIDTGIKSWNTSIIIETEMAFTDLTVQRMLEGAGDGFYYGLNNNRYELYYNAYWGTADTNYHIFKKSLSRSSSSSSTCHIETYIDGTSRYSSNSNYASTAVKNNVFIFANSNGSVGILQMKCRKKYFIISVDGFTVFYGIPVRKGTTGYLYDKISGELFGNDGSDSFVLGPDVT